jgi:uncharacterized membrane protein
MTKIRFCNLCERNVGAQKKFNWTIFLLGVLTFGIISTMYLIYYILKSSDICPICGNTKLSSAKYQK